MVTVVGRSGAPVNSTVVTPGHEAPWLDTLGCNLLWVASADTLVVQLIPTWTQWREAYRQATGGRVWAPLYDEFAVATAE